MSNQEHSTTFTDELLANIPAPASHAELMRIRRLVDAAEALYYPKHVVKREEKEAQRLLAEQKTKDELLQSEILRHMERIAEKGEKWKWVTANGMIPFVKSKLSTTREEVEQQMKNLSDENKLERRKTNQSVKYKLK